jgi:hypothetical protein
LPRTRTISLLAAALLAVTLPWKFLASLPLNTEEEEDAAKMRALGDFLRASDLKVSGPVKVKPPFASWLGWRAATANCEFLVAPSIGMNEGTAVLRVITSRRRLHFVYRSAISEELPLGRINRDQIVQRMLWPFNPAAFRQPLVVAVIAAPGCDQFRAWHWDRLWS